MKTKGARKIGFAEFKEALKLVAERKGMSLDDLVSKLKSSEGPVTNATQVLFMALACHPNIVSRPRAARMLGNLS